METADAPLRSAVLVSEIESKIALGKFSTQGDPAALAQRMGYRELALRWSHAREGGRVPLLHRDPFDRMLIAQARVEGLALATADGNIRRYDVATVG